METRRKRVLEEILSTEETYQKCLQDCLGVCFLPFSLIKPNSSRYGSDRLSQGPNTRVVQYQKKMHASSPATWKKSMLPRPPSLLLSRKECPIITPTPPPSAISFRLEMGSFLNLPSYKGIELVGTVRNVHRKLPCSDRQGEGGRENQRFSRSYGIFCARLSFPQRGYCRRMLTPRVFHLRATLSCLCPEFPATIYFSRSSSQQQSLLPTQL